MGSADWRHGTGLRGGDDGGHDQVPRLDRRLLGGAVLAPEGLHARLHDRARLHGEDQAGVRPARREDHRPLGRPGRQPRGVGRGHRGDAGHAPNYPIIGDADFNVSKLYGMLPADTSGDPPTRTPADNQTVRNVFVIGPDKKIKLILVYPMTTGPQLRRGAARDRLAAADRQAQGRDAGELAAGRGRDHRRLGLQRRGQGDLFGDWESPKPYIRIVPQPHQETAVPA